MREVPKSGPLVLKGGGQLTPPPLATGLRSEIRSDSEINPGPACESGSLPSSGASRS